MTATTETTDTRTAENRLLDPLRALARELIEEYDEPHELCAALCMAVTLQPGEVDIAKKAHGFLLRRAIDELQSSGTTDIHFVELADFLKEFARLHWMGVRGRQQPRWRVEALRGDAAGAGGLAGLTEGGVGPARGRCDRATRRRVLL